MYEMEGPQAVWLHHPPIARRARVAGPTTYLEDLVAFPGCPGLAIDARFAPVSRPDPNTVTSAGFPTLVPPESLPNLLRSLPRIWFPASAVT